MLALAVLIFEVCELAALGALVALLTAGGVGLPAALGVAVATALGWRAMLVLLTALAGDTGWPGWWNWWAETWAFTRAYLAMGIEPLRVALERLADVVRGERAAVRPGPKRRRGTSTEALPHPSATALVLVHGWCCNAGVWRPLRAAWRRHGGARPLAVSISPVLGDLDVMAHDLARRLAPLVADRRPILLVSHSMGGLVARRWLQLATDVAPLVVGLVTVGTPHAGTRLARFGLGRAAAQMRPDSDWLAALAEREPPCPVCCVWSDADAFVVPASSALLPRSLSRPFPGRGHFGMLRDPRLAALLAGWPLDGMGRHAASPAPAPAGAA